MTIVEAFTTGSRRIWRHKRMLLWLYGINLAFAAVLLFPFRNLVARLSKTELADDFVKGFPLDRFMDFWARHSDALKSLGQAAVAIAVLYTLFHVFLSAGIVATFASANRVRLRWFTTAAGRFFWRYARLFCLQLIAIVLVVVGYKFSLGRYIADRREELANDFTAEAWRGLGIGVLLVTVAIVLLVFDYAKIRTVVDKRRSMFLATLAALGFVLRRFYRTMPLFGLNLIILGLLLAMYLLIENQITPATIPSLIALVVLQQFVVLGRIWMKLSFYASQLTYYESTSEPAGAPSTPSLQPVPYRPTPAPRPSPTPPLATTQIPPASN